MKLSEVLLVTRGEIKIIDGDVTIYSSAYSKVAQLLDREVIRIDHDYSDTIIEVAPATKLDKFNPVIGGQIISIDNGPKQPAIIVRNKDKYYAVIITNSHTFNYYPIVDQAELRKYR